MKWRVSRKKNIDTRAVKRQKNGRKSNDSKVCTSQQFCLLFLSSHFFFLNAFSLSIPTTVLLYAIQQNLLHTPLMANMT